MANEKHGNPGDEKPNEIKAQELRASHGVQKAHFPLHLASTQFTTASTTGKRRSCHRVASASERARGFCLRASRSRRTWPSILNCVSNRAMRGSKSLGTAMPSKRRISEKWTNKGATLRKRKRW